MNILEMSDQEIGRRQSLQQLREMGIDPYPAAEYPTNAFSTEIRDEFKEDERPALSNFRIAKAESKFTSPATTFARARTKTYTT